jgi:hypothetical protein
MQLAHHVEEVFYIYILYIYILYIYIYKGVLEQSCESEEKGGHCRKSVSKSMAVVQDQEALDEYTQDGTVDLRGNPARRSKRGGWTACSFIVGNLSALSRSQIYHSNPLHIYIYIYIYIDPSAYLLGYTHVLGFLIFAY